MIPNAIFFVLPAELGLMLLAAWTNMHQNVLVFLMCAVLFGTIMAMVIGVREKEIEIELTGEVEVSAVKFVNDKGEQERVELSRPIEIDLP
jgi:hypothetical protein